MILKQARKNYHSREKHFAKKYVNKPASDESDEEIGSSSPAGDSTSEPIVMNESINNKKKVGLYPYTSKSCNILLIGLSYHRDIVSQVTNDKIKLNMTMCVDHKGRGYNQCVIRDTFGCFALEQSYPNVCVHTVNKCTDSIRTCDNTMDPTNINCDVTSRFLIPILKQKSWYFNEVYVDTFCMQKTYIADNFGANFFKNLAIMFDLGYLVSSDDKNGKIFLPFNPHFFVMVHSNTGLLKRFEVSYLRECDICKETL